VRGLYRGLVPTVAKQSATSDVRMGSYNALKQIIQDNNIPITGLTTFTIGAAAGVVTVYATQPFDAVKTRAQCAAGMSMKDAVKGVLRETGIHGLWRGSTMRRGRLILSGGTVFSVYEHMAWSLGSAKIQS
jgi:solute carrier family 25 citrate transporter 1